MFILSFLMPYLTAVSALLIAGWAIFTGIEIVTAIHCEV